MLKDIIEVLLAGVAVSCIISIILIGYSIFRDEGIKK